MVDKKLKNDISEEGDKMYVPSETERKKVILMYFFVGILAAFAKKEISAYELFHLKQALGWWATFFIMLVIFAFLFFIPYIRVLPILLFLVYAGVWVIFVKQGWEGKYYIPTKKGDKILLPFFHGIGEWILHVFEFNFDIKK